MVQTKPAFVWSYILCTHSLTELVVWRGSSEGQLHCGRRAGAAIQLARSQPCLLGRQICWCRWLRQRGKSATGQFTNKPYSRLV